MGNIKTIQAAFNLKDPDQEEMYNFIKKRTNASNYIKRIIWNDMKNIQQHKLESQFAETIEDEVDHNLMMDLI